jgi:hypothetical protein
MVYKPSEDRMSLIDDETGAIIEPTPGLYFADRSPMLSMPKDGRRNGIERSFFYAANRVEEETIIKGVQWSWKHFKKPDDRMYDHAIYSSEVTIPEGSLLLRSFAENSLNGIEWYALTPSQVGDHAQNIQRKQYTGKPSDVSGLDDISAGAVGNPDVWSNPYFWQRFISKKFSDAAQRKAHLDDAKTLLELKLATLQFH